MQHHRLFHVFLGIYLILLLIQTATLPLLDIPIMIALISGAGVAVIAHYRHGSIMIGFLLLHMGIEWSMGVDFGILFFVHTLLDLVFLWTELTAHAKRYRMPIFVLTLLGITILALSSHHAHAHDETTLHHVLILGGMLTCTIIHMIRVFQQKKPSFK